ncbi:Short-chain dehydrogenase/reductase family 16C member 6, partial [Colius striatus]
ILKILQFLKLLILLVFENVFSFLLPPHKKSFAGEIVLITGSANGIGRRIALNFAPLGATLVLWDIDDEGNKETSRLAQKNGAKRVFAYHCDCSNREEVYEQADQVRKDIGDVTILINNAGTLLGKKFCDIPDADFENTLRVNFLSHVWTCKAFLPAMMTCNRGHLVSMASAAGLLGAYRMSDYAGSNSAVIGMMEALDSELYHARKQGVKITVICPYFINTELAKGFQT